jgi:pimeloyl-ACP methyl ester carboxylesterase
MPSLTTDDGRTLAWREAGAGPPLLCHPGGPGCSAACFGGLSELAAERTVLLLDPRGTGGSDRPADPSAYDLEDYAADIEAVREYLGLERLDVLGHSHGGFVAITWAGTYPESVSRLVLASTAARFTPATREGRARRIESHRDRPYYEDAMAALAAHQEGRFADDAELSALYLREWRVLVPADADAAPVLDALAAAGANADALRHFNARIAGGMDLRPLLADIDAPTLVLTGGLDVFGFGPEAAREIADGLPRPTPVVLETADHLPFLEHGSCDAWSRAVLGFLRA